MASVCTVKSLEPVKNTDNLVVISMNENLYNVLGNKQMNLNVGDKVVYFEVDSILPLEERYTFLKKCYKESLKGYLIKAMKMRGVYSFGLILKGEDVGLDLTKYNPRDDLTQALNVRKYEVQDPPSHGHIEDTWKKPFIRFFEIFWDGKFFKKHLEDFPTNIIPKSDEENLWNNPELFDKHKNDANYISVKMEGKSVTCFWDRKLLRKVFKVFGRNKELSDPGEIKWFTDNIGSKMKNKSWRNVVLQGEFCSPKIQKGIYQNGTHFYVFKIKDLDTGAYLSLDAMKMYCELHGLETVPILDKNLNEFKTREELAKYVETLGFIPGDNVYNIVNPKKNKLARHHEGIVVTSYDRNHSNWSFKVKSQEYQLGN